MRIRSRRHDRNDVVILDGDRPKPPTPTTWYVPFAMSVSFGNRPRVVFRYDWTVRRTDFNPIDGRNVRFVIVSTVRDRFPWRGADSATDEEARHLPSSGKYTRTTYNIESRELHYRRSRKAVHDWVQSPGPRPSTSSNGSCGVGEIVIRLDGWFWFAPRIHDQPVAIGWRSAAKTHGTHDAVEQ